MSQFLRKARVIISEDKISTREISGLRISFRVEQSTTSNPNPSEIKIYNLSEETIALLKAEEAEIFLEAGYKDSVSSIAWGNDLEVDTIYQGPEKITIIKARDGGKQLAETKLNLQITPGADMSQIVGDIISKMKNIAFSGVEKLKLLGKGQFLSGGVFNGMAKEVLDGLLGPAGVKYSIQKGEIKLVTSADIPQKVVLISPLSGLIGSPQKTKEGVKAKVLLNPGILPTGYASLTSREINGIYKVTKLVHEGDTHGPQWTTEWEGSTI